MNENWRTLMKKLIAHLKTWNKWRKSSLNSRLYKLGVLFGLAKSPTIELNYEFYKKLNKKER